MIEGKRAIIFVGIILNVLLLNQSVTSNLKTDSDINAYKIVPPVYDRLGHLNSSITNQCFEIGRHRSDLSQFRDESFGRITNARLCAHAEFSIMGRSEGHFQFERKRIIFREPHNYRQKKRAVISHRSLPDQIQRRSLKLDFDNRRYIRYSEAPFGRSIRKDTNSLPKSRFLNSESTLASTTSNNGDRRISSGIRDSRISKSLLYKTRELSRNVDQFKIRIQRSIRTSGVTRDQNSKRVSLKNSETSNLVHSFFRSTLSQYFPDNSLPSLELYYINDFVVSIIAGIFLYDIVGAMTQKAVTAKKESLGNFAEKIASAVQKMVAH